MIALSHVFTILVIVIYFYIMTLEMFFWTKPSGLKAFGMSKEKAKDSAVKAFESRSL